MGAVETTASGVAVSRGLVWMPIDEHTPTGVRLLLLPKNGLATVDTLLANSTWYTHWFPLPVRSKE